MTLDLAGWTPTEQRVEDVISPARVAAWYATLDHRQSEVNTGQVVPPGFHWTLGQPAARQSDLGDDGHARLGAFFPPIALPRRMWAGSTDPVSRAAARR